MITVLHRGGGYAQMITISHGGGGSLGTHKSDYVICARPLINNTVSGHFRLLILVTILITITRIMIMMLKTIMIMVLPLLCLISLSIINIWPLLGYGRAPTTSFPLLGNQNHPIKMLENLTNDFNFL